MHKLWGKEPWKTGIFFPSIHLGDLSALSSLRLVAIADAEHMQIAADILPAIPPLVSPPFFYSPRQRRMGSFSVSNPVICPSHGFGQI